MTLLRPRMPARNTMVDETGMITRPWRVFFRDRGDIADAAPTVETGVSIEDQSGAIGATPFPAELAPGLYRVSVYAHRTVVAATSSSLGVVITWQDGGVLRSASTAVDTSNLLANLVGGSWMIRIDPYSVITYEVLYASVAANQMQYRLDVTVEQVKA